MSPNLLRHGLLAVVAAVQMSCAAAADDVPPDMARQPAAATCPGLRSGTYRVISPTFGGLPADQTGTLALDAARLAVTRPDGSTGTWQAQEPCRFVDPGDGAYDIDVVVSSAGVLAGRVNVSGGASHRTVVAFPEQAHALTELAGAWNLIGLRSGADGFYADAGQWRFDAAGSVRAATECGNAANWSVAACTDVAASALAQQPAYRADARGGFVRRWGALTHRLFLYRAASGPPMLVGIGDDGTFFFGTPAAKAVVPAVGAVFTTWNLDVTGRLASATSTYINRSTVLGVDAQQSRYTRTKKSGGLADEHVETLQLDSPRPGYVTRPRGEAPGPNGLPVRFNEFVALRLPDTGATALVLPGVKLFEFSIITP